MKRIPLRLRILGGALLLIGLFWGIDSFTGTRPATASAAGIGASDQTAPERGSIERLSPAALLARLTQSPYVSVADDIERLDRDLFAPTPAVQKVVAAAEPHPTPTSVPAAGADKADPDAAFQGKYQLTGVVIGAAPLAVIGERVMPVGAELEGYVLREVQRDYVVFQSPSSGRALTLALRTGPDTR